MAVEDGTTREGDAAGVLVGGGEEDEDAVVLALALADTDGDESLADTDGEDAGKGEALALVLCAELGELLAEAPGLASTAGDSDGEALRVRDAGTLRVADELKLDTRPPLRDTEAEALREAVTAPLGTTPLPLRHRLPLLRQHPASSPCSR